MSNSTENKECVDGFCPLPTPKEEVKEPKKEKGSIKTRLGVLGDRSFGTF